MCIRDSSRRVHQNIEAAKVFDYLLDTLAASRGIGYVAFQESGLSLIHI